MENKTGIKPIEYKVLILPDPVSDKTEGGIIVKSEQTIYEDTRAQVLGTLVAVGGMAFTERLIDGKMYDWGGLIPTPGDKVIFSKYQGQMHKRCGKWHRLMNDKDVCAVDTGEEE